MKCSACKANLPSYHEGELSPRNAMLIVGHLASCAACSAYSHQFLALDRVLGGIEAIAPISNFTAQVMAKVKTMAAPCAARPRLWLWITSLIALGWGVIAALNVSRVMPWQSPIAEAGTFAAKGALVVQTLIHVGSHFHIATYVAMGVGAELAALILLAPIVRKYFQRSGTTLTRVRSL